MNIFTSIFILLYIGCLIAYFFSETSGNFKRRAINKIILASMFFIYGLIAYSLNYDLLSYHLVLLLGITFAFLGDVFLLFSFSRGGIFFMTSNITIFIYEIISIINYNIPFINIWYFIPLLLIIWGSFFTINLKGKIDLKDKKIPILTYIFTVTLHATLSIPIAIYVNNIAYYMLSIGLILFMISDYFLIPHKFKCPDKKWVLRCNSGFYFIGLLLVVLSLIH